MAHLLLASVPARVASTEAYVRLRRRLSSTPRRFERPGALADWRPGEDWRHRKVVFAETDLVVDGFPGSANSFVSNALREAAGEGVHVTSHFHHTAQLARALAFGVPAVVVVREPRAACDSLKSKEPALWDALIVCRWIHYHRFVLRHLAHLDVFLFEEVTRDLDCVRRHSAAVRRLVAGTIVADAAHRRASRRRVPIRHEGFPNRRLLEIAGELHERIRARLEEIRPSAMIRES